MKHKSQTISMLVGFILMVLLFVACSPTADEGAAQTTAEPESTSKTLFVGGEQADCTGVAPQQCLLVKENADDKYTFFYDVIEGFTWEEGFEYELLVEVTEIDNPSADASTMQYKLIEVVNKAAIALPPTISFLDGSWTLSELLIDGVSVALPDGSPAYLLIEDEQVSGSAACNTFSGSATFDNGSVQFGPLATTLKACPEDVTAVENALLSTYESATTFATDGTSLEFSNEDGSMVARFVPQSEVEAVPPIISFLDGKWAIGEVMIGGENIQLPYGNAAYLMIDGESVSGLAGCNTFAGTATFDKGAVGFDPLAVTLKACADETVMAFETALLSVLDKTTLYTGGRTELVLSNDDGSMIINLTPVREQTLFVGAEQADCVGIGPQKCLLVKENADDEYTFFYDKIVGFEWEEGFEYELLVGVSDIANPPADASSLRYELVEVVNKVEVSSND